MEKKAQNVLPFLDNSGKFNAYLSSALVFSARYAHHRNTGAPHLLVCTLEQVWPYLPMITQESILLESKEASYCPEDWERLRKLKVTSPRPPESTANNSTPNR